RNVRIGRVAAVGSDRKSSGLRVSVRIRRRCAHLFHHFPLMLLFLVLCPLVAAILIIVGAPARFTALVAAILNVIVALALFFEFDRAATGFQFVTSFVVSTDWRIHFAFGVDGL